MKRCYIKYYYPSLMEDGVNFCRISRLKNLFWEDLNKRLTHMGAQSFFEDTKFVHVVRCIRNDVMISLCQKKSIFSSSMMKLHSLHNLVLLWMVHSYSHI